MFQDEASSRQGRALGTAWGPQAVGEPVNRHALAEACQVRVPAGERPRTPDLHVVAIRRKLGLNSSIIVTVPSLGYAVDT